MAAAVRNQPHCQDGHKAREYIELPMGRVAGLPILRQRLRSQWPGAVSDATAAASNSR